MNGDRPARIFLALTGGFLAAAVVVGAGLGALEINGVASPLDRIETLTLDWRFLLAGARPAPAAVVIVAIDDETLSERGDAPPREMMPASCGPWPLPSSVDRRRYRLPQFEGRGDGHGARQRAQGAPAVVAAIGVFDAADR